MKDTSMRVSGWAAVELRRMAEREGKTVKGVVERLVVEAVEGKTAEVRELVVERDAVVDWAE
jgi:hypothetical protein